MGGTVDLATLDSPDSSELLPRASFIDIPHSQRENGIFGEWKGKSQQKVPANWKTKAAPGAGLAVGSAFPRAPQLVRAGTFLGARRLSPDERDLQNATHGAWPHRRQRNWRTAHAAARRFGPQRRARPLREFQSSSAKAFALELQAMNTAMDNLSLIPRPGSLA